MNTTVVLVRHGQTDWNVNGRYMGWTDEALNAEGLQQAVAQRKDLACPRIAVCPQHPIAHQVDPKGIP